MIQKIVDFIKDTRAEMSKVVWPTRETMLRDTVLVIIVSLGLAFFLGFLDTLFQYLLKFVI